jgi:CheY-like chemotaxis protein
MSHELRTPINGIIGFSNLLLKPDNTLEKKEKYVSQINASTSMLLRLIEDIIDIAKIESGSLTIEKAPCRPFDILKELFTLYQQELKARNKENIQLVFNKYSDSNFTIVTDPFRLRQVLLNLLSNAVKFTSQGKIEYGFSLENNELLFYVKDTGIGIKQENIKLIFERFAQLELSLSRKFGGTGLGLTISKNIVEHLGGKIWVESDLEKGSSFFFNIPAEIIPATENVLENVIFNPNQYQWGKFTVLVAEDDDLNFMFIEEMLSETKIKLIRAKNGLEAIDAVKNNSEIELVLMDIQMPFMDGYQSTREILLIKPHLPIIAQTAFALASEKELSFKAGCIDYISKPLDMEELLIKIKKYLPVKF